MKPVLPLLAAFACCCACAAEQLSAQAQSAREDAIHAEFSVAKERCRQVADRKLRNLCRVQAYSARRVALAELDVLADPSPANRRRLVRTQAEAAFGVENQRCLLLQGPFRGECRRQARARLVQQVQASAQAKPQARERERLQSSQRVKLVTSSRGVWKPLTRAETSAWPRDMPHTSISFSPAPMWGRMIFA